MSIEWSGWAFGIIISLIILIYNSVKDFSKKIYLECYKEVDIDGMKSFSESIKSLGEYKDFELDPSREGYLLSFRKGRKTTRYYCPVNIEDLMSHWMVRRYLIVRYIIDAFVYERKLPPTQQYEKELKLKTKWVIYNFLTTFFLGFHITPVLIHTFIQWLVLGIIFGGHILVLPIGFCIVLTINYLNEYMLRNGILKPEKEKVLIVSESFLMPINPTELVLDVYNVDYIRREQIVKEDGAEEIEEIEYENEEIVGYAELQDFISQKNIKMVGDPRIVGQVIQKISVPEMKSERRDFLSKLRALYEETQNKSIAVYRLQEEIRRLHEDISYIEETKDREIQDMAMKFMEERDKNRQTLKQVFKRLYTGQLIEENWEDSLKRALREIDEENQRAKLEEYKQQSTILAKILELLEKKVGSEIDFTELKRKLLTFNETAKPENEQQKE